MPIEVGKRAPMFTLPADSGEKVALSALSALAPRPVFSLALRTLFHTQTRKTRVYSWARASSKERARRATKDLHAANNLSSQLKFLRSVHRCRYEDASVRQVRESSM